MYLSKLQNVFVGIAKCICWNCNCAVECSAAEVPQMLHTLQIGLATSSSLLPSTQEICSEKNFAKRDKLMQCQIYPRICKRVQKFHLLHPVTRAMCAFISASFQFSADIKFTLLLDECLLLCSKAVGFNVNDMTVCISSNLSIIKILFQH